MAGLREWPSQSCGREAGGAGLWLVLVSCEQGCPTQYTRPRVLGGNEERRAWWRRPRPRLTPPGSQGVATHAPADEHRQDDGEPPELQDLHDWRVLLGDEDAWGGQGREADADQRRQIPTVWGEERGRVGRGAGAQGGVQAVAWVAEVTGVWGLRAPEARGTAPVPTSLDEPSPAPPVTRLTGSCPPRSPPHLPLLR